MSGEGGGQGDGRQTDRQTGRRLEEGVMALHYASALVSVRGGTPVSHSAAVGPLPWQAQSKSLANITAGPWREQGADVDERRASCEGLVLTEGRGRQGMKSKRTRQVM